MTRPLERPKQDVRLAAGALVRHDAFRLPVQCFYVIERFGDVLRGHLAFVEVLVEGAGGVEQAVDVPFAGLGPQATGDLV